MNKTSEAFEYFDRAKVLNETGVKNIVNEKVIPMIIVIRKHLKLYSQKPKHPFTNLELLLKVIY
jgi:hypothetical protein